MTFFVSFHFLIVIAELNEEISSIFAQNFFSNFCSCSSSHPFGLLMPNTSNQAVWSFPGPRLHSPNERFRLDFIPLTNYTNLNVLLVLSNDSFQNIWYAIPSIPIVNDFDKDILENKDGALRIRCQLGGIPIKLCSFATNKTAATLLDSGNVSTKRVLWQSFDHLESVLIQGMKLGVNHKTGQNWSLTSRLTLNILNQGNQVQKHCVDQQ